MEEQFEKQYMRAKLRVQKIKEFYIHLITYGIVNIFLIVNNLIIDPNDLWFIFPLLGWGIGVVFHAFNVYGRNFSKGWERRKISELMLKDDEFD